MMNSSGFGHSATVQALALSRTARHVPLWQSQRADRISLVDSRFSFIILVFEGVFAGATACRGEDSLSTLRQPPGVRVSKRSAVMR
jgi:hypothetical protein